MADFNQAVILGRLTKDPELRSTAAGQSVTSFSVATNRRWTSKDGQAQEDVEFHNIVAWGKLAEICAQILYKGRQVLVAGRLQTRSWEGQDGLKRFTTEIVADQVSAVGPAKSGAPEAAGVSHQAAEASNDAPPPPVKKPATVPAETNEINVDDIPF